LRRDETIRQLEAMLPELRHRFDVHALSVFGSVARDEATDQSDLDVVVQFGSAARFMNFMALREHLEDVFGVRVDLVTDAALDARLRRSVEAEALRVA
jgi:predicted nucleotidyltransferase